jgi:hypothetical protein
MEKVKNYIHEFGLLAICRLPFYPILLLLWGPIRISLTLWNARILARGKWSEYTGFNIQNSITQLFYWSQVTNIDRFGRDGTSKYAGMGNSFMGTYWHLSLPSLYLYKAWGAILPIVGIFMWWFGFLWWLDVSYVATWWSILVLVLVFFSSTFYSQLFTVQNYNAFGWAFFSTGLWAILEGHYVIAGLAWFAASFGGITVILVSALLACVIAYLNHDILALISVIPSLIKVGLHLRWASQPSNCTEVKKSIWDTAVLPLKLVGILKRGIRYKRAMTRNRLLAFGYCLVLYIQFAFVLHYVESNLELLWVYVLGIFITNALLIRFADNQSMYIMMFSVAIVLVFQKQDWLLLCSFWLVASPLPLLFGDASQGTIDYQPPLKPFNLRELLQKTEAFFADVPEESRVMIAYEDPNEIYQNLFDGYGPIAELPLYIATKNKIHLFPNWQAIIETNYEGAPHFWGRSVEEIKKNISTFDVDYIIVYQDSGTSLLQELKDNFTVVSEFDWGLLPPDISNNNIFGGNKAPKWWLLENTKV